VPWGIRRVHDGVATDTAGMAHLPGVGCGP